MLFDPIKVGTAIIRNRVVVTAHGTNFGKQPDSLMNDKHLSYLERRARGGVGMIVTEVTGIHPTTHPLSGIVFAYDEKCIPRYERLSNAIHKHNCKILAQLWHAGRQTHSGYSRRHVLAPTAIPCPLNLQVPKEMEAADIREIVDGYVRSAGNVKKAGMDGVELHGAHGYLICQFLSTFSNKREDEYGGSLDNRMRFAREIIDGVRAECGKDFIVGFRLSADEFVEGGIDVDVAKEIAKKLESTGKIDYISISAGNYTSVATVVPNSTFPVGWLAPYSSAIKSVTKLPVIVVSRINDPVAAENILADGHADMVGICRGTIADPDFVNKAKEGKADEIRKCMGCMQGCTSKIFLQQEMTCVQNPVVGFESELDEISRSRNKKDILVVGGGPAGMEFARVANLRGHRVRLYERDRELGGQINLITRVKSREEFGEVRRYRETMLKKQGVEIVLGKEVDATFILEANADAVVIATGSLPRVTGFDGSDHANVVNCTELLRGSRKIGKRVLVVGEDTYRKTTDIAEFCFQDGADSVEIVTQYPLVGLEIDFINIVSVYKTLYASGVRFSPNTVVTRYDGKEVTLKNIYSGDERVVVGIDTVVVATWNRADDRLYKELRGRVKSLFRVGDSLAPRTAMDAIHDAYRLARDI